MISLGRKDRKVLATLGAEAALAKGGLYRDAEMTHKELLAKSEVGFGEIDAILERLVNSGFARKRNTGYNGYGDHWVEGVDVWAVTPAGLVALWTA